MPRPLLGVFLLVLSLAQFLPAPGARAAQGTEPVCIVTDLSGKAQTQGEKGIVEVALLSEFPSSARTRLEPGARMVVLYLKSGEQFALQGPALIRFGGTAPSASNGAEPTPLRPLRGKDGTPPRIRVEQVTQAAIVARSGSARPITALVLSNTVTLELRPVFRWREPEPGLHYALVLEDNEGATLFSRSTAGDAIELPAALVLVPGAAYRWTISARAGAGAAYLSVHRFSLADAATRLAAENYRPPDDATLAERVAYAAWLDGAGLRDEANAQWVAIERSGGPVAPLRGTRAAGR